MQAAGCTVNILLIKNDLNALELLYNYIETFL
jgi:hypothetical protein